MYYDAMRRKIEKKGTLNFPQLAGKKLYGELTMTMTVNADGSVLATEVVQSSGNPTLDRWAQSLVQGAGPFDAFSEAMRAKADQIVVVSQLQLRTRRQPGNQADQPLRPGNAVLPTHFLTQEINP